MGKPTFMPNLGIKKPAVPSTPVTKPAPPVKEVTEEVVEEIETTEMEETETAEKPKKERKVSTKERKTPNRQMNPEDISFILQNVKNMSYHEMAEARGITKHQVNRILMQVKKDLREKCANDEAKLAKVEEYIKSELSRPEDAFPGGSGRTGVVKETVDSLVDSILEGI